MHELAYDVIIAFVFMGIIYIAIGIFNSNIELVGQSTYEKTEKVEQLDTSNEKSSLYTASDIIAYLEEKDVINNPNIKITIINSYGTSVIDNTNRLTKINNVKNQLSLNITDKYRFQRSNFSFTKTS